jgi:hypothetical protein
MPSTNLRDLVVRGDLSRIFLEIDDNGFDGQIDAALQIHRIEAGRHRLGAFARYCRREHGRRGGSVAGGVMLLVRDFAHELGAEVFEPVGELDLLGDSDPVLGDARRAVGFFDDDVTALRAQGDFHRIVEDFDAAQDAVARVGGETDVFGGHGGSTPKRKKLCFVESGEDQPTIPRMSLSFMINSSWPSILTSVPDHLPNSTRSPAFTSSGMRLPLSSRAPGPTATISPSWGFSLAVSGMMMPPLVFSSPSRRLSTTRS